MGFLGGLFGKKDKTAGERSEDARGRSETLNARYADIEALDKLIEQDRWGAALEIVERILALPADGEAAGRRLQTLMQDSNLTRVSRVQQIGKDAEGRDLMKVRLGLGGGAVPHLMSTRAQCISNAAAARFRSLRPAESQGRVADAELLRLRELAIQHATLCRTTRQLWDDPRTMLTAGGLSGAFGAYDVAREFYERALVLTPGDPVAEELLAQVKAAQAGRR